MISKLDLGGVESRFDGDLSPHDHVRCVHCGRVDDVALVPLDLSTAHANYGHGFQILGRRLELVGICPQCQNTHQSEGT